MEIHLQMKVQLTCYNVVKCIVGVQFFKEKGKSLKIQMIYL